MSEAARGLERYRPYLLLLARQGLRPRLQAKADVSGLVQQTLLEAHAAWPQVATEPEAARLAWLRRLLANNLRDEAKRWNTAARNIALEQDVERSAIRLESLLAGHETSPTAKAERNEQLLALAAALAELPEPERLAIELHHLLGLPLAEVAGQLGRTKGAVAALLYRALERLRRKLQSE